jgi:hypothetical protein
MVHSEVAQSIIVKAAKQLLVDLKGEGLVVTIIIEDTTNQDRDKGLQVCTNISKDIKIQQAYLKEVAEHIK